MERKPHSSSRARERKLRAKFRRTLRITVAITLIVGLVLGILIGHTFLPKTVEVERIVEVECTPEIIECTPEIVYVTPEPVVEAEVTPEPADAATEAPVEPAETETAQTAEATAEVTAEPAEVTAEPVSEPTPAPVVPAGANNVPTIVFGGSQTFTCQVNPDGTVDQTGTEGSETVNFTMVVKRSLTPEYYEMYHANDIKLKGNEAGIEFELTLLNYSGTAVITPQELMSISLETADGTVISGYQLTNAEVRGEAVTLETNVPTLAYKRFQYDPQVGDVAYLCVTVYNAGVPSTYRFEVGEALRPVATPTPAVTYAPLQVKDKGEAVTKLQTYLIAKGYLSGEADGKFGNGTATAVKAAQAAFGMEQTGIADNEFQQKLYSDDAPTAAEAEAAATPAA